MVGARKVNVIELTDVEGRGPSPRLYWAADVVLVVASVPVAPSGGGLSLAGCTAGATTS